MDTVNSAVYIEDDRLYDYAAATARLIKHTGSKFMHDKFIHFFLRNRMDPVVIRIKTEFMKSGGSNDIYTGGQGNGG